MQQERPNQQVRRGRPRSRTRRIAFATITVVASSVLAYYACESVYRLTIWHGVRFGHFQPEIITEQPLDQLDPQTGFRYASNVRTRFVRFLPTGEQVHENPHLRTNNQGMVSHRDVPLEKPPGELRIGMLGDSFTACLEMTRPWPDIVEDLLDADSALKKQLGCQRIRVLNFGLDGIGIEQCAAVHRHWARQFQPDLVVLNFIADDLMRQFLYRNPLKRDLGDVQYFVSIHTYSLPCSPSNSNAFLGMITMPLADYEQPAKRQRVLSDLAAIRLRRVRWFSPYPELFASRIGYRFGLPPRVFTPSGYSHYANDWEAIGHSVRACRQIRQDDPHALFLYIPIPQEREEGGSLPAVLRAMKLIAPDLGVILMDDYLPADVPPEQRQAWYIPGDGHFSDEGGKAYAQAVARLLRERLPAIVADRKRQAAESARPISEETRSP